MSNAVFGKTMVNLRNRRNVTLVNCRRKFMRLAAQPSFKNFTIFHEDLIAVKRTKVKILLNRPIFVVFTILDISKTLMYEFHFDYMKKKYPGEKSKLIFTDTASLTYVIVTEDIYNDMFSNKEFFDFSDYDKDSKFYNTENMKKTGKMKGEMKGTATADFVGLRAKMYSILTRKGKEVKKTKGVNKSVVKHAISHANYINC